MTSVYSPSVHHGTEPGTRQENQDTTTCQQLTEGEGGMVPGAGRGHRGSPARSGRPTQTACLTQVTSQDTTLDDSDSQASTPIPPSPPILTPSLAPHNPRKLIIPHNGMKNGNKKYRCKQDQ